VTEILKKIKKNKPSKPVKTSYGWHIIKYSAVRDSTPLPFEKVKDNIRNQLMQKKVNEIKSEIFNDSEIEVLIEYKDPLKDIDEKNIDKKDSSSTISTEEK
jgi:peptidyl-prolyl cis-trans isomerase C